uniref:hypothetical protein n=1 Tax=Microbacterium proteolyticum TaxID=1572644 RepID=UPI002416C8D4|nr:hypothetical protein [Microbacterium proteolyticum]
MTENDYPTWAQVSTVDTLARLVELAADALDVIVDPADRSDLHDILRGAERLMLLVDGHDSWIDLALAFDAESAAFIRHALTRRLA